MKEVKAFLSDDKEYYKTALEAKKQDVEYYVKIVKQSLRMMCNNDYNEKVNTYEYIALNKLFNKVELSVLDLRNAIEQLNKQKNTGNLSISKIDDKKGRVSIFGKKDK